MVLFVVLLLLCFKVCESKSGADIGVLFSGNNDREIFAVFDVYSKLLFFEITVTNELLLSISLGKLEIAVNFKIRVEGEGKGFVVVIVYKCKNVFLVPDTS